MILYRMKLPNFDATPKNVLMWDALSSIETKLIPSNKVYLMVDLPVGTGSGPCPPGTYPAAGHVRAPDAYGPTGVEFTGTEVLPAASQVGVGVGFGAGGTEFTGTLAGGSGKRRIRGIW